MMKIHKILFLALLLACATSCEEDKTITTLEDSESVQDAANSDGSESSATVRWTANGEELASNEPSVSVGGYLTLKDTSEGVVSREWLVSSGDLNSVYFLEGDFKNTTETDDATKYDAYIDDETTLSGSSSEAEINLYFKAIGSTTMILRNYYSEPVYKKYEDAESGKILFAQSVIDGDSHVIDIPIIVNVNGEGTIDWSIASEQTMTTVEEMFEYNVLVGSSITFNDLSLWDTSHSWSVDGSGVNVTDGSYANDIVELEFTEAGTQTVTLKNYYAESTTCDVAGTSYTTEYSSGYCFDFDIKVNVYAADVVSAFKVYTDETCLTEVTEDIEVDANTTLYFKDLSTGGYSSLVYSGYDGDSSTVDASENIGGVTAITFTSAGSYDAFTQTVTRGEDGVDAIPDYKTNTATFEHTITVKALEEPVALDTSVTPTMVSNVVTVTFVDVTFTDVATNSAAILDAFSLSVVNDEFNETFKPTAVAINANNAAIDLTFPTLYNTDVLKLTYTAPATTKDGLVVADGRGINSGVISDLAIKTNLLVNPLAEASDFSATGYDLATYFTMCAQTSAAPGTIAHSTGSISLVNAKDVVDTEADGVKWLKVTNSTLSGCYMLVSGADGGTFDIPATAGKEYYSTIELYMDSDYVSTGYFSLKLTRGSGSNWWDANDSMLNTGSQKAFYDTSLANIGSSWGKEYLADNSYTLKSGTYIQFYSEHKDRKFYYLQTSFQGTYYIKSISFTNAQIRP